jgi:hypothetical protein
MAAKHPMMPLGIVDLLKLRGFDQTCPTKIARLKSNDPKCDLDDLRRKGWLDFWQATQRRPVFDGCEQVISFIGTEGTKARFIGVYRVRKLDTRTKPRPEGYPDEWDTGEYYYDFEQESGYEDLVNRVVIEWGKGGAQAWVQNLSNKEIVEMLPKGQLRPLFRDYLEFTLTHAELKELYDHEDTNREWRARLAAVAGIYLVLATTTGAQYVGSASGTEGIWGRWAAYAHDGHGGNKLLKDLIANDSAYPAAFTYSILQILPKSFARTEVLRWEQRYKDKLGSQAKGLNAAEIRRSAEGTQRSGEAL